MKEKIVDCLDLIIKNRKYYYYGFPPINEEDYEKLVKTLRVTDNKTYKKIFPFRKISILEKKDVYPLFKDKTYTDYLAIPEPIGLEVSLLYSYGRLKTIYIENNLIRKKFFLEDRIKNIIKYLKPKINLNKRITIKGFLQV